MTKPEDEIFVNFKPTRTERMKRAKARSGEKRAKRDGNDLEYLKKLRSLPCVVCGNPAPNTVHHLKDTGQRGAAMRSPDKFGLPLCMAGFTHGDDCHGQVERIGSRRELRWFADHGIDAIELCYALWGVKHSYDAMLRVLMAHRNEEKPEGD